MKIDKLGQLFAYFYEVKERVAVRSVSTELLYTLYAAIVGSLDV